MDGRPAIYVRIKEASGAVGYGEIWCNFPARGAAHRVAIFESEIAPLVAGRTFDDPSQLFEFLSAATRRLSLQTGELGPFAQCIAGLDIAVWDMLARRADMPLYRFLDSPNSRVPVYASGINPDGVAGTIDRLQGEGHTRFKLKVGFEADTDKSNAQTIRAMIGESGTFMIDANQAWTPEVARDSIEQLLDLDLFWVEEPMHADVGAEYWQALHDCTGISLAAGENYYSFEKFEEVIQDDWLDVIQPDICKWGGISRCLDVLRAAKDAGKLTCPHSLGGGVALAGSAHLWAAVHGNGFVEVDSNPNPLRENVYPIDVVDGVIDLKDAPGLGVETDVLDRFFLS